MANAFNDDKGKVDINAVLNTLETNYQNNVNTVYNAFVNKGVTPTAKTPSALATAVTTTYNKGTTDAQAVTWTETIYARVSLDGSQNGYLYFALPYRNVVKIKNTSGFSIDIYWKNGSQILSNNGEMNAPANITLENGIYWYAMYDGSMADRTIKILVTFQAKRIR